MKNNAAKDTSAALSSVAIPAPFGKVGTSVPGPSPGRTDTEVTMSTPAPGSSTTAPSPRRPRRRQQPPLPEEIHQTLSAVAKEFRAQHGKVDRETADRAAHVFRALIIQHNKGGRKITPTVALAISLHQQGRSWSWIYSNVIPGFGSLAFCMRRYLSDKLRHAVRFHLSKARTKSVSSRRSVYAE